MGYNDYELDEMENAAVNKSKNLKRGIAAGAGILGVGATAAAAAAHYSATEETELPLDAEDILAGANAGADEAPQEEPVAEAPKAQTTHTTHHIVEDKVVEPEPHHEEVDINVNETAILFDENGEVLSSYDKGTVNGMDFVAIDSDNNGKADILAIDENYNGIYEDNEIHELDNNSYQIGQGENLTGYMRNEGGEFVKIYESPNPLLDEQYAYNEQHTGGETIHNDFEDERTGEIYRNDLAENNMDYNNRGGEQYSAGIENAPEIAYNDEPDSGLMYGEPAIPQESFTEEYSMEESYTESVTPASDYAYQEENYADNNDYGYTDPSDDTSAFDATPESFDDINLS